MQTFKLFMLLLRRNLPSVCAPPHAFDPLGSPRYSSSRRLPQTGRSSPSEQNNTEKRGGKNVKTAVMTSTVLAMSFLSGLMVGGMKHMIQKSVPFVNQINPAALISDCFYHLAVTSNDTAFIICIATLLAEAAVFGLISAAVLKKQRYRSL